MSGKKIGAQQIQVHTTWKKAFRRDWQLYLLLLFPLLMVIIFSYAAYPGLRMVFMDYKPARGYDGSEWVGLETFIKVFRDADFHRALRNSIVFNVLDLVIGFPMPVILALILNELRFPRFKKVTQTILYLPHFLSWAIIGSVAYTMFRPSTGLVNMALMDLGLIEEGIPFLTEKFHCRVEHGGEGRFRLAEAEKNIRAQYGEEAWKRLPAGNPAAEIRVSSSPKRSICALL